MENIFYKKGYKYQLASNYVCKISIKPGEPINTDYINLDSDGMLTIKKSYAWDGPSGPTFDTRNFMRGSLVHDALYQLMRGKHLAKKVYRNPADKLLQTMCKEDGMSSIRAWWVFKGLRLGGGPAADPSNKKQVIRAPK
jgi:hypothetical protein